ncbi:pyridoxal 5'-phosphate synthase glutaminase subunit PdxT [Kocuria rhizophila]|uniref:pyridoxal 5'-phosphate synthase glutaminase subunit PdxT n=1 Tax=Kocuria rhizophila TaxID=72000 RepID=UPI000A3F4142|nr:pyridoxal 5'-phosphate synthase glutaminase subunit PdxT [Kocuria rhizophila]
MSGSPSQHHPHDDDALPDPSAHPAVGVLALQGGVVEHVRAVESLGARAVKVRSADDLVDPDGVPRIDALILPGGESSTVDRLCRTFGLFDSLQRVVRGGLPTLGTCAGLIMLSSEIEDPAPGQQSLGVLDVSVNRNAFGSQVASAEVELAWEGPASGVVAPGDVVRAAFIRAPEVTRAGDGVEVLARHRGAVVAVRQGSVLGISFHPELTGDTTLHRMLLEQVAARRG